MLQALSSLGILANNLRLVHIVFMKRLRGLERKTAAFLDVLMNFSALVRCAVFYPKL